MYVTVSSAVGTQVSGRARKCVCCLIVEMNTCRAWVADGSVRTVWMVERENVRCTPVRIPRAAVLPILRVARVKAVTVGMMVVLGDAVAVG